MTNVKYVGGMDTRELGAADFKKLGVDGAKKMVFTRDEVVEVEDDIAQALLHATILPGEFEIVEDKAEPDNGVSEDGGPVGVAPEPTAAQKAKIAKAAKAGTAAAAKVAPAEEVAQDGHPQTTSDDSLPTDR